VSYVSPFEAVVSQIFGDIMAKIFLVDWRAFTYN